MMAVCSGLRVYAAQRWFCAGAIFAVFFLFYNYYLTWITLKFYTMEKFVIKKGSNDQYYFNLKADNGQTILTSEEYTTKAS